MKADIFHAYQALLKQTKPSAGHVSQDPNRMEAEEGPVSLLQTQVIVIIIQRVQEKWLFYSLFWGHCR